MKISILILTFTVLAAAQMPVAPTPEPAGSPRGENAGGYNITNSFETGYRWSLVDGDLGKYRSDVNYGNGIRLLGSSLAVQSREGHGRFFDQIVLTTLGLGNDPYQSAMLRVEKNSLYRYDMLWRLNEFYNPGLITSGGEHLYDTRRRLQDHDFTLFPQSWLRFHLGYSRNSQTGPALSTIQVFEARGDEFPLFTDVKRLDNQYRLGMDVALKGFKLTIQHRWDDFKEDTPYALAGTGAGNNPSDLTTLSSFRRNEPYHGTSPGWLGVLQAGGTGWWAVNARASYTGGVRAFVMDESAFGTDRFGDARNRQVLVTGNARRPVTSGDFSFSLFPTSRLTFVNATSVYSIRIDGDSFYREFNNATFDFANVNFQYLGIRTVSNVSQANYRAAGWLTVFGRYGYSNRLVRTTQGFGLPGEALDSQSYEQENRLHTGGIGFRFQPVKPFTLTADGEVGRADHPLTPISEKNYHAVRARADYRLRKLQFSGAYRQVYNINAPLPLSIHSSHSRQYSGNVSWAARDWFGLDASYSKLHLDTASGLAFFTGAPRATLQQGYSSIYTSNIHAASFGSHFTIAKRVNLYAGYAVTRDTGDGRSNALGAGTTDPVAAVFLPVQSFPLAFHSPMARVSVRITPKLRWNAGWQFYRYREDFGVLNVFENYRAHTGYTSVSWSF